MRQFVAETEFNSIVVIESLPVGYRTTGQNLFSSVVYPTCIKEGMGSKLFESRSRSDFVQALQWTAQQCEESQNPWMPIVHLETHGDDERNLGLLVGEKQELLTWQELCDLLRPINRACANRCVVVVAACGGINALKGLDHPDILQHVAPYYAVIGPEAVVYERHLEEAMKRFYGAIFEGRVLNEAVELAAPEWKMLLCEGLLGRSAARYLWEHCRGRTKKERVERLTTILLSERRDLGLDETIGELRRGVKERLRGDSFDFEKYKRRFLMADDPRNSGRFTVDKGDLIAAVQERAATE